MGTGFRKLNDGWNAEPNAPDPSIRVEADRVTLSFLMNAFQFPGFSEGDVGSLSFNGCWQYRLGSTNDEGWHLGQCRFSGAAPKWGEFYEVTGDLLLPQSGQGWVRTGIPSETSRHFLFYLRDNTFECDAVSWDLVVQSSGGSQRHVA